jgi:hypothetical protein
MKPRLYIFKRDELEHYDSRNRIYFVVVNLDRAKKYPANFVCVLPTLKSSMVKPSTEFSRAFGKDSFGLAKKMLREALEDEDDAEIRAEIEARLKLLEPDKRVKKSMLSAKQHFNLIAAEDFCQENPLRLKR